MQRYVRPLVQMGPARPTGAVSLAGGSGWFTHVEVLRRQGADEVVLADQLTDQERQNLTKPRTPVAGLDFSAPVLMGILNVTPDSFSDGGRHDDLSAATLAATKMAEQGAHLIDIGGESTRPGAAFVPESEEIERTAPVIAALRAANLTTPISIDTRKSTVANAALDAGANIVNDVSGFGFDPDLAPLCAARKTPVCVMHAQGDPATMQDDPQYGDVVLDVYDYLLQRIEYLTSLGIPRDQIIADPGIGFGKKLPHNLKLLHRISLFHSLGVPILLGASRKKFIGTIGNVTQANARGPGSVGVAIGAISQGIQIIRAHDVAEHAQAIALWRAGMAQGGYD